MDDFVKSIQRTKSQQKMPSHEKLCKRLPRISDLALGNIVVMGPQFSVIALDVADGTHVKIVTKVKLRVRATLGEVVTTPVDALDPGKSTVSAKCCEDR